MNPSLIYDHSIGESRNKQLSNFSACPKVSQSHASRDYVSILIYTFYAEVQVGAVDVPAAISTIA